MFGRGLKPNLPVNQREVEPKFCARVDHTIRIGCDEGDREGGTPYRSELNPFYSFAGLDLGFGFRFGFGFGFGFGFEIGFGLGFGFG